MFPQKEIQAYQKLDYTISIFQIYKHSSKGIKMTRIKCAYEKRAHGLDFLIILLHNMTALYRELPWAVGQLAAWHFS